MKIKQTNAEGVEEEIEVASPAEVQAKLDEQKNTMEAAHKAELDAKEGSLSSLAQEKKDLESKILKMETDGMKDDHPNFKILKDALNKKDEDIKAIKTDLETDRKMRAAEDLDSKIKIATKGNEDLEKKIRYHLEKTVMGLPEGTKEERQVKLDAAIKLASDGSSEGPGIFDGGTGGGGKGSGGSGGENAVEFTTREKALGKKLGLTDADYKKYGGRVSKR